MKKALVTGVTGQDGAYLSNFLLNEGYFVYGAIRRTSNLNKERLDYFNLLEHSCFKLCEIDLTDQASLQTFFKENNVDEVYNLAAQSFVGLSFTQPILTANITGLGPLYLLEAIKSTGKKIKFYQASSSELFGKVQAVPQDEKTPFYPRSPYGNAKLFAHWSSINYRESYDMFTANGILFNHESPLRGLEFVTRKITNAVAKIKHNISNTLELGNLNAKRDWGFAGDYVVAMHKMLQHDSPDDFVISTGVTVSVRDFVKKAFQCVDLEIEFSGDGIDEVGILKSSGKILVKVSKEFYRPAEVDLLIGNPQKAKQILGWEHTTKVNELVEKMVAYDLQLIGKIS